MCVLMFELWVGRYMYMQLAKGIYADLVSLSILVIMSYIER